MFTIEVKKKEANEKFSFEDIQKEAKVIHDSCYHGKVEWKVTKAQWIFKCQRCGAWVGLSSEYFSDARTIIVKTAIDGKERTLSQHVREGIRVIWPN